MIKPILFNTEMVRAILDGRKTVTRRVCKITINGGKQVRHTMLQAYEYPATNKDGVCANFYDDSGFYRGAARPPFMPGDILYVRETWNRCSNEKAGRPMHYEYRADCENPDYFSDGFMASWRPSIHMPKEAARIFLRVTDVRVEQLQNVRYFDCINEGVPYRQYEDDIIKDFSLIWNRTVKKTDLDKYGWVANPFVWVIEFEKCAKPEEVKDD